MTPETTLVLATAEAHSGSRGVADDPGRTLSPPLLRREYRVAGFERWVDGSAWFLRPACCGGVVEAAS